LSSFTHYFLSHGNGFYTLKRVWLYLNSEPSHNSNLLGYIRQLSIFYCEICAHGNMCKMHVPWLACIIRTSVSFDLPNSLVQGLAVLIITLYHSQNLIKRLLF
jgi:hypothetical protein